LHLLPLQLGQHVRHQLLAQTSPLVEGMNGHIPDRGIHHAVTGAAGKADKLWHPWVVAPDPYPQQAVL